MENSLPYADIVILALVAGFILLRLRSVLGQKGDHENPDFFKRQNPPPPKPAAQAPVVQLGDRLPNKAKMSAVEDEFLRQVESPLVKQQLEDIKQKDPQFSVTTFVQGAKMAYEMVFDAFAKGDKQTLKMLLDEPIYNHFVSEIDTRANQDSHSETTLVSVRPATISEASMDRNLAKIAVRFTSEQITVVRGKDGTIVEGDPSAVHEAQEEWTFERDLTSRNPNWKIIET